MSARTALHRGQRVADEVRLRTLFAVEPDREDEVRERIAAALASGRVVGPDGRESRPPAFRPAVAGRAGEEDHARGSRITRRRR